MAVQHLFRSLAQMHEEVKARLHAAFTYKQVPGFHPALGEHRNTRSVLVERYRSRSAVRS